MSSQYVFTMHRLSRVHPPDKEVLKEISLSFLPGAKIGVLGYNGAGKSTLLAIMAGIDTDYRGDAMLAPGASVGLLKQEPTLDESKDVRANVEDGVAEQRALLDRFNELSMNYSDETAEEFGRIQERIDAVDAWDLDSRLELAMDALRLPPPDADVERCRAASGVAWRSAGCCCNRRTCCCSTSRRTTSTPSPSPGSSAFSKDYPGTVVAVTHDRYFLDNVAGWILELDRGRGIPWEGNYSLARAEAGPPGCRRNGRDEAAADAGARAGMDPHVAAGAAGERQGASQRLRGADLREERDAEIETSEIYIAPGPRLGDVVVEAAHLRKGYGDHLLIDDLTSRCRAAASSA